MNRLLRVGFVTVVQMLPVSVWGDPPRLTGTSPLGVQRGKSMEVTLEGTGLIGTPRLVAPFKFQVEEPTDQEGSDGAHWKVKLTIDTRTGVGIYPVRVATESGVSNPILFAVGQLPQVKEVEPNNTFPLAQSIPAPVVVEGECSGNDQDFFRFKGRKGERIVVDAVCSRIGSGVDPMIRLTTADWRFVASADDTPGLFTDGYFTALLPEDGEFVLEFSDSRFAGQGRAVYRLLIGAVPYAGEVHPFTLSRGQESSLELRGGTLSGDRLFRLQAPSDRLASMFSPVIPARLLGDPAWANSPLDVEFPIPLLLNSAVTVLESVDPSEKLPPLSPPVTILGRLSQAGERDEYTITAPSGSQHEIRVEASGLGSALDGHLRVLARDGRALGETDDGKSMGRRRGGGGGGRPQGATSTDPAFDLTMPQGTGTGTGTGQSEVRLIVKDLMDRGGVGFTYRVVVTPVEAAFQLGFNDEQVSVPRGGTALIPVSVTRSGYKGPIALEILGIPTDAGVTILPGIVPAGQTNGVVGIQATPESPLQACEVQIVGHGERGPAVAAAKSIVFAEQTISSPGFGMGGTIPSYARPFLSLTAAVTRPGPILLKPDASKVVVPLGSTVEVALRIHRMVEAKMAYKIEALSPPTGLHVAETEINETGTTSHVKITAAADAPLGPLMLGLIAQRQQSKEDANRRSRRAVTKKGAVPPSSSPPAAAAVMIAVEIVRPAALELAVKEIRLKPGTSVTLTGKLTRIAPFAEEVEVKLNGLPPGVKADPVKVATMDSEFLLTLQADKLAPAAEANATAVMSYMTGNKVDTGVPVPLRVTVLAND